MNLFDSGYLNKNVQKENKPLVEKNRIEDPNKEEHKAYGMNKAELLRNLEENILQKSADFDEIFEKKKLRTNGNSNEKDPVFSILPIDETMVFNLIQQNNNKINFNDSKRYTLSDIEV